MNQVHNMLSCHWLFCRYDHQFPLHNNFIAVLLNIHSLDKKPNHCLYVLVNSVALKVKAYTAM